MASHGSLLLLIIKYTNYFFKCRKSSSNFLGNKVKIRGGISFFMPCLYEEKPFVLGYVTPNKQPTFSLHELCLEVSSVHGNVLGQDIPPNLTINVAHLTYMQ